MYKSNFCKYSLQQTCRYNEHTQWQKERAKCKLYAVPFYSWWHMCVRTPIIYRQTNGNYVSSVQLMFRHQMQWCMGALHYCRVPQCHFIVHTSHIRQERNKPHQEQQHWNWTKKREREKKMCIKIKTTTEFYERNMRVCGLLVQMGARFFPMANK